MYFSIVKYMYVCMGVSYMHACLCIGMYIYMCIPLI